jgi:hypothetical protein
MQIEDGGITEVTPLDGELPDIMIGAPPGILLANASERSLVLRQGKEPRTTTLPTPDRILDIDWYSGNAYVLTDSSILKVSDLETLKSVSKQWLNDVSDLAADALHIAVDGDIWTLSQNGKLTKYYRGKQIEQTDLGLNITSSQRFITTPELPLLYIADLELKRIHIIDKETATLVRTITLDTQQEVLDVFLGPDQETLYILAGDGKIWKVE